MEAYTYMLIPIIGDVDSMFVVDLVDIIRYHITNDGSTVFTYLTIIHY